MARTSHPDITPMFVPDEFGGEQLSVDLLDPAVHSTGVTDNLPAMDDPKPGASVDLRVRNEELQKALGVLGKMSSNVGYRKGAEIAPIRRRFEQRGDHVDRIAGRMANAEPRLVSEARLHFGRAFGSAAMHGAGFMSVEQAESAKDSEFGRFRNAFADKKNRESRDVYKKKLGKQARALNRPPKK